jgi:hypothetical protein
MLRHPQTPAGRGKARLCYMTLLGPVFVPKLTNAGGDPRANWLGPGWRMGDVKLTRGGEMKTIILCGVFAVSLSAQRGYTMVAFSPEGSMMRGRPPVKGAPYSAQAVSELTRTLADGTRVTHSTYSRLYRDSEGRERCEETSGDSFKGIFISDPVEHAGYSLDLGRRVATRTTGQEEVAKEMRGTVIRFLQDPLGLAPETAAKGGKLLGHEDPEEPIGTRMIEGISAVGTRATLVALDGRIESVDERWVSPDLHIAMLVTTPNSPWGSITYKLTNIIRDEQPRALFEVPADYKVVSPYRVRMLEITRKER